MAIVIIHLVYELLFILCNVVILSLTTTYIMKSKILTLSCIILYVFCISSCVDEEILPIASPSVQSVYLKSTDDLLKARFTQGLHHALKYKEVRIKIKSAIIERFDGDYNILFAQLKDERITVNRNGLNEELVFGKLISEGIDTPKESSDFLGKPGEIQTKSFLDSIAERLPLLQIAIPELPTASAEEWSAENSSLPIAIVPENIVDDKVPVIGVDGTLGSLSATTPPESLVIVISRNERVIALPKSNTSFTANVANVGLDCTGDPFMSTNSYDYVLITDYYDAQNDCTLAGLPSSSGGGNSGSTSCDRDIDPDKDELHRVKFKTIEAYRQARDGWLNSRFELKVIITLGTINGVPQVLEKMIINDENEYRSCGIFNCDPRWVNVLSEVITWDKAIYGDKMHYSFYEYDGTGDSSTITVQFPVTIGATTFNITSSHTIKSNDFPIGNSYVEYCDNSQNDGYTYNTGTFEFQVRQR
jgi:hypothetical protein